MLVGQPWSGVDAWEELTIRRRPFQTEAACARHLDKRIAMAKPGTTRWLGARCVTAEEFQRYPQSKTGDFGYPGDSAPEPD